MIPAKQQKRGLDVGQWRREPGRGQRAYGIEALDVMRAGARRALRFWFWGADGRAPVHGVVWFFIVGHQLDGIAPRGLTRTRKPYSCLGCMIA